MVAAAMAAAAAAAFGTNRPPSNTSIPRPLSILNSQASSSSGAIRPPSSAVVVVLRNPTLRSLGNLLNPSTRWNYALPSEQLGLKRLSSTGGLQSGKKKCGVAVVAVGQQRASRDRVVDFGKNKGAMMGTLSSKYLKWMVKNLNAGPLSEWSEYAEEVLADPYYEDRLEWEKVEKLMTAAHDVGSVTGNRDAVLAPARMFGWDLKDEAGWRKVNFSLLGTTKGGRIPRVKGGVPPVVPEKKKPAPRRRNSISVRSAMTTPSRVSPSPTSSAVDVSSSSGSLRDELEKRRAQRRDRRISSRGGLSTGIDEVAEAQRDLHSKFPGRAGLLSKVRTYDITE